MDVRVAVLVDMERQMYTLVRDGSTNVRTMDAGLRLPVDIDGQVAGQLCISAVGDWLARWRCELSMLLGELNGGRLADYSSVCGTLFQHDL